MRLVFESRPLLFRPDFDPNFRFEIETPLVPGEIRFGPGFRILHRFCPGFNGIWQWSRAL
jgi:hypothetical protein